MEAEAWEKGTKKKEILQYYVRCPCNLRVKKDKISERD